MNIVNITPHSMSGETHQDSCPSIAVNPNNPNEIVISAFTPGSGANAPVYVSTDGGSTWTLQSIVPGNNAISGTGDITVKYGSGGELYAGILNGTTTNTIELNGLTAGTLNILRTTNPAGGAAMAVLDSSQNSIEEPYVAVATVPSGPDAGKDRLYVGINDLQEQGSFFNSTGQTATIRQTMDAQAAVPVFTSILVDQRVKNVNALQDLQIRQDGPQVRPAVHTDGTVYALFYSWKTWADPGNGNGLVTADVIIVRDDNWGQSASPYTALVDSTDSLIGQRISINVNLTQFNFMGQERIGGELAIAVDPTNSSIVYVAWAGVQNNGTKPNTYVLHLRKSTDRGQTWSKSDLLSVTNGKNPGLAINDKGQVGFLYQQYTGRLEIVLAQDNPAGQRWETHLAFSTNGSQWTDLLLATVPASSPGRQFFPYIGDFANIMAVGDDFYGVFCANNTPDLANFPQGVSFQRNHSFGTKQLFASNGITPVAPSIDPFFFTTGFVQSVSKPPSNWAAIVIIILFGIINDGGGAYIDGSGHIHIVGPGDPGPVWDYLVALAEYRLATASDTRAGLEMQRLALQNISNMAGTQIAQINAQLGHVGGQ